jgi:hypothetical protein
MIEDAGWYCLLFFVWCFYAVLYYLSRSWRSDNGPFFWTIKGTVKEKISR